MSIASQLTALEGNISDAYDMVAQRGGTVPQRKNMENLDDAIATIPSGGWAYDIHTKKNNDNSFERSYGDTPPTINTPFVPNDITAISAGALIYAYKYLPHQTGVRIGINLNSIRSIGIGGLYYAFSPDQIPGMMISGSTIRDIGFANLETVDSYGMAYSFRYASIESYSFPNLTTVGSSAFEGAFANSYYGGTGVAASFPALTTITGNSSFKSAFQQDSSNRGINTADFSALEHADSTQCFYSAFQECRLLTSVDFGSLVSVGQDVSGKNNVSYTFNSAFRGCTSLTTVDFSSLETIFCSPSSSASQFQQAFYGCTSLPSIAFPALTTASKGCFNNAFNGCTSLTTVDFSSLDTVGSQCFYYAFQGCTSLASISFGSLSDMSAATSTFYYAFSGCTSLASVSFPALTANSFGSATNHFSRMLQGCSNVTVHFPAAIQSTIGSWSDVTNGFGGTNTTVLFDL